MIKALIQFLESLIEKFEERGTVPLTQKEKLELGRFSSNENEDESPESLNESET